jgi:glutaredoxin
MSSINDFIAADKVVIFSKTYCPYCSKVKALFTSLGVQFTAYELDKRTDGAELQNALINLTGRRTVPAVFISGKDIGGCDDTHALHSKNALLPLLA